MLTAEPARSQITSNIGFFNNGKSDLFDSPSLDWGQNLWLDQRDYKKLGEVLAKLRGTVTQNELADRLDKPQSFVSSYETGQRRVDLLEFLRITSALKLDPVKVFADIARKAPFKAFQRK